MRLRRRDGVNVSQNEHQEGTEQAPTVPQIVSTPPRVNIVAIEDDDDVVESTASAFAQVCSLPFLCFPLFSKSWCLCRRL